MKYIRQILYFTYIWNLKNRRINKQKSRMRPIETYKYRELIVAKVEVVGRLAKCMKENGRYKLILMK